MHILYVYNAHIVLFSYKRLNMKAETDKFAQFCKTFAELSDESQDKLVKIAHRLLKTHQFAKHAAATKKFQQCYKNGVNI